MNNLLKTNYDWYLMPVAAFAVVVGVFVRFWDLGGAPLAVDEYYLGTSILNIMERGLPEFACGGIYPRGLLTQYLTVPFLYFGASLEFSVRFWPAIASILTIAGVWRISKVADGPIIAPIAVILTSLSLWEIEFGRFGRMYAPFQAMFVWYVYFQIQHLIVGKERAKWAYLGISALSIFEYSGAIFLLLFNFLPLVWREKKWTSIHLAVSALTLVLGVIFHRTDFRSEAVPAVPSTDNSPASEVAAAITLPIKLPPLPDALLPILICGLVLFGVSVYRFRQQLVFKHPAVIFWLLATLCLSFGLVAASAALAIVGIFLGLPLPALGSVRSTRAAAFFLVSVIVWAVVLIGSFQLSGAGVDHSLKSTVKYMFAYPNVYRWAFEPWLEAIPLTTVAMIVLTIPAVWSVFRRPFYGHANTTGTLRYLFAIVILSFLLVSFLWQPTPQTRYTYFLYPIITVAASAGIVALTRSLRLGEHCHFYLPLTVIGALFLVTEDYSIRHMVNINDPEYRFRNAYNAKQGMHYYFRWDFRGAAEYVNAHLEIGDRVITFADVLPHYLDRTDGAFVRNGSGPHASVSACNGTRHVWSNVALLDQDIEVEQLIENTQGRVWMIMRTPTFMYYDPLESSLVRSYSLQPMFRSEDGNLEVYQVDSH